MHPRRAEPLHARPDYAQCAVVHGLSLRQGQCDWEDEDEWYAARIRTFLLQYSRAIVEQQESRCVIVYTDKSYVNVNHARKFTWYHPEAPEKNDVVRASGKGKRLVLLHAFTQDGWLTRDSTIHNGRVDQCALSCELIYQADKDGGDYHNNMNGSMYMQWLINRLLPSFAERYPGQRMVLVLDNAAYHHHRGADWINPHRLRKAEMAAKLIELGVSSMSVQRQKKGTLTMEQHAFDAASFSRHGGRQAPTLAELKAELIAYLAAPPGMNRTEVAKLLTAHGQELIYTPPYQQASSPSSGCGRTSRTTWPLSTSEDGQCLNSFCKPIKAFMGMICNMLAWMQHCVRPSSSTRTISAMI